MKKRVLSLVLTLCMLLGLLPTAAFAATTTTTLNSDNSPLTIDGKGTVAMKLSGLTYTVEITNAAGDTSATVKLPSGVSSVEVNEDAGEVILPPDSSVSGGIIAMTVGEKGGSVKLDDEVTVALPAGTTDQSVKVGPDAVTVTVTDGGGSGSVNIQTGAVTLPADGSVSIPRATQESSSTIIITAGADGGTVAGEYSSDDPYAITTVPAGSTIRRDGSVQITLTTRGAIDFTQYYDRLTVDDGGSFRIGVDPVTTITPSSGGFIEFGTNDSVFISGGTKVTTGGTTITVHPDNGESGKVTVGGAVTVAPGDKVSIDDGFGGTTEIRAGGDSAVFKPAEGGAVLVQAPGGASITNRNGSITDKKASVPAGADFVKVNRDGGIADPTKNLDDGEQLTFGGATLTRNGDTITLVRDGVTTTVTLPTGDTTVPVDDSGTITLRSGSKVKFESCEKLTTTGVGTKLESDHKISLSTDGYAPQANRTAVTAGSDPKITITGYDSDKYCTVSPDAGGKLSIYQCSVRIGDDGPKFSLYSGTVDPGSGDITLAPGKDATLTHWGAVKLDKAIIENPYSNSDSKTIKVVDGFVEVPAGMEVEFDETNIVATLPDSGKLNHEDKLVKAHVENGGSAVVQIGYNSSDTATATIQPAAGGSFTVDQNVTVVNGTTDAAITYKGNNGSQTDKMVPMAAGETWYTVRFLDNEILSKLLEVQPIKHNTAAVTEPTSPVKDEMVLVDGSHYKFKEWRLRDDSTYSFTNAPVTAPVGPIFANWEYKSHSAGTEWTYDKDDHWKECTLGGGCTKKVGQASHDFASGSVCTVCRYDKNGANTCTVTFISNGGSAVEDQTVRSGGTVVRPSDPTREGYTFKGWFSDVAFTTEYDFTAAVTGNITLYAKWQENSGESPTPPAHAHTWSTDWSHDDAGHWHTCTTPNCPINDNTEKDGYSAHIYDNDRDASCNTCSFERQLFGISGTVAEETEDGSTGSPLSGIKVTLKKGSITIGDSITTGSDGQYSFDVAPGSYNVVAEQTKNGATKTKTILVTIAEQNEEGKNIELPFANVNSKLDVAEGASITAGSAAKIDRTVVGGLDEEAKALAATDPAKTVTVTMTVKSETADGAANADKIKAKAQAQTGVNTTLEYMEIKVQKKVEATQGGTTTVESEEPITATQKLLEIIIPFDFDGKVQNSVTVYRYHGANVDILTTAENADKEYITYDAANIIMYVKNFSTYAIGYTETAGESPTPPAPSGGGSSGGGGGGGSSSYTPTTKQPEHGKVSLSPARPGKGDKVTVTVTPESGYAADTVTVTDQNGKPIEVTKNPDGTFSFIQPAGKVTVSAALRVAHTGGYETCPRDETCPIWPYTDASAAAWYHDGVHYCVDNGLMTGYGGGRFGPDKNLSRAMLAQILYSQAGKPGVSGGSSFEDVAENAWYAKAVAWAAAQGIVSGYGDSRFGPNDPVTREQLALMLWRNAGSPASTQSLDRFTDGGKTSSWAADALRWAVERGILSGKGGGVLDPTGQASRAEAATMLMRYPERTQAK